MFVKYLFIIIFILSEKSFHGLGWKKVEKPANLCSNYNNKLMSLLNLLCNTTQTISITTRDGCYGCFFRATSLPPGHLQLQTLTQCALVYLMNTNYRICAEELQLIINGTKPTPQTTLTGCYTGYCDFVRCVRRINANALIADCFSQNYAGRDITDSREQVFLYKNVTNCILAKARCSLYNPISGELQNNFQQINIKSLQNFRGSSYLNSLQISSGNDLRIITFPATTYTSDTFCVRSSILEQSSYESFTC